MIQLIEFQNTFVPDTPGAHPATLDAYFGEDIFKEEHFTAWQVAHPDFRIISVSTVTRGTYDVLIVAYEAPAEYLP